MSKVVCALYEDPVDGYPSSHARRSLRVLERYPGGRRSRRLRRAIRSWNASRQCVW